jgi:hypothetical protein
MNPDRFWPGKEEEYFPRAGKPGHKVVIVEVLRNGMMPRLRFRYQDGRVRIVSIAKFHTEPHVKE